MNRYHRVAQRLRQTSLMAVGATLTASLAMLAPASSVAAQTVQICAPGNCPTNYGIQPTAIQRAPGSIKFQAQISKAKMPIGEGKFKVIARVLDAGSPVCTETFPSVMTRDSVLNLEIGKMSGGCNLEQFAATKSSLALQICIDNTENCLKPIDFASVPYSMKATYASQAAIAENADTAAQCSYTHRIAADEDLFLRNGVGIGYFDMHTPATADVSTSVSNLFYRTMSVSNGGGAGYISWSPASSNGLPAATARGDVHVCARGFEAKTMSRLANYMVHSAVSTFNGDVKVAGQVVINNSPSGIGGTNEGTSALRVSGGKSEFVGDVAITASPAANNTVSGSALSIVGQTINSIVSGTALTVTGISNFMGVSKFTNGSFTVGNNALSAPSYPITLASNDIAILGGGNSQNASVNNGANMANVVFGPTTNVQFQGVVGLPPSALVVPVNSITEAQFKPTDAPCIARGYGGSYDGVTQNATAFLFCPNTYGAVATGGTKFDACVLEGMAQRAGVNASCMAKKANTVVNSVNTQGWQVNAINAQCNFRCF